MYILSEPVFFSLGIRAGMDSGELNRLVRITNFRVWLEYVLLYK